MYTTIYSRRCCAKIHREQRLKMQDAYIDAAEMNFADDVIEDIPDDKPDSDMLPRSEEDIIASSCRR